MLLKNAHNNAIACLPVVAIEEAHENSRAAGLINAALKNNGFFAPVENKSEGRLQILLSVSNRCNLHCTYCFEQEKNTTNLSKNTADSLLKFIDTKLCQEKFYEIDITFTGGEPLINPAKIDYITKALISTYGQKYSLKFSVITNGTLYTKTLFDTFEGYPIEIQITLDGFRPSHNNYRIGNNGEKTFDLICTNIDRLLKETNVNISLRINMVTKNNSEYLSLLDLLEGKWSDYYKLGRIRHYFAFLDVDESKTDLIFSDAEMLTSVYSICAKEEELSLPMAEELRAGSICMIRNKDGYTIDADGMIYGCFSFVGNKKFNIGNVQCNQANKKNLNDFICNQNDCSFFQKCYGGCIYSNYIKTGALAPFCRKEYYVNANKILFAFSLQHMGLAHFACLQEVLENVGFGEINI